MWGRVELVREDMLGEREGKEWGILTGQNAVGRSGKSVGEVGVTAGELRDLGVKKQRQRKVKMRSEMELFIGGVGKEEGGRDM